MSVSGLLQVVRTDPILDEAITLATEDSRQPTTFVGPPALTPLLTTLLASPEFGKRQVLLVTANSRDAEDLSEELTGLLGQHTVAEFPAWETLPHERLSPTHDTVGRRLSVLRRLQHPGPAGAADGPLQVVVAGVRALLAPFVAGLGERESVAVSVGDERDMDDLVHRLIEIGYERTDLVTKRGELAVRGGIVDVFAPTDDHPTRLEFFGDEIEQVRRFSVADQRSLPDEIDRLWAPSCRELLLSDDVRSRAADLLAEHPELADVFGPISEGIHVEGMESLAPVLADGMSNLLTELDEHTIVLLAEPERIRRRADDLLATSEEFLAAGWQAAADGGKTPIDVSAAGFLTLDQAREVADDRQLAWWTVSAFGMDADADETADPTGRHVGMVAANSYRGDLPSALGDVAGYLRVGGAAVVLTKGHGSAQRLSEQLAERELAARLVTSLDAKPATRIATVATSSLRHGFAIPADNLIVLTEADIFGTQPTTVTKRSMPSRRRRAVDPLQLTAGDYVVHEAHGVGRFVELTSRVVQGSTREYLVVEYAASKRGQPADRLYVPTDQLDQVTRYVGGEAPSVHRLGGADWEKSKTKARRAVKQIAGELIRLYAARQQAKGHAFAPDSPWQAELEDAFPFAETPDQLATIDEVKSDMEKSVPMDRIVCGDVGYGKTEIAVRAAFKAVQDGKQVAVLVPTTLLVRQHHQTFSERFAPFPVRVEALSRFQTARQADEVLAGLADGSVDVIVATHRLLSPSTQFKDLGLVIVDEEQRFGVEHKEHLKALRTNVDMLTMSATPIPRTLEMAVTGIREMSTIATPPEQRLPVLTFVGPYEAKQVTAAIKRELLRDGQVFFIHNRVDSIERAAAKLAELVPDARIAVAHGQMSEGTLETVIDQFWQREIDVLVCTTIVENGLDITNANTLIVDRADTFGISQLHQLRGRVGRGRDRAYAYFFYPPEKPLTETAHDRLTTIATNTDLGAGMAVAMKDLEIRGAGNLLGGEQSGHIADVGFDLYVRLVGEALAEFKGEESDEPADVTIELAIDAHIPTGWIPHERLRLEAYRRFAAATDEAGLQEVLDELVDRYGALPEPVQLLVEVARLRMKARQLGITEIITAGTRIRFSPMQLAESRGMRLTRLYPGSMAKAASRVVLVPAPMTAKVGGKPLTNIPLLQWINEFLDAMFA